jgi:hypothetical protein
MYSRAAAAAAVRIPKTSTRIITDGVMGPGRFLKKPVFFIFWSAACNMSLIDLTDFGSGRPAGQNTVPDAAWDSVFGPAIASSNLKPNAAGPQNNDAFGGTIQAPLNQGQDPAIAAKPILPRMGSRKKMFADDHQLAAQAQATAGGGGDTQPSESPDTKAAAPAKAKKSQRRRVLTTNDLQAYMKQAEEEAAEGKEVDANAMVTRCSPLIHPGAPGCQQRAA